MKDVHERQTSLEQPQEPVTIQGQEANANDGCPGRAGESMERVLAIIGHELRTPLAALRATVEFLLTDESDDLLESRVFLQNILGESIRMSDLVNNMLEAARLDSGYAKWNWTVVDLSVVIDNALNVVRPLMNHSRVALELAVTPGLIVRGDADALQRMVINLVTNSAKFTNDGFIRLETAERFNDGERRVEISVKDSGGGIAESMLKKLGKAFVLNSGAIGSNYVNGTGLGLAICRGIAAAHGGVMTVQSEQGKGATFTVDICADLPEPVSGPEIASLEALR